jgi:hypothetical protein
VLGSLLYVITSKNKKNWQQQAGRQAESLHGNRELFLVFLF